MWHGDLKGIPLGHEKGELAISDNMDAPGGVKLNEVRERETPYDFTHRWNLRKQMNKAETDP